MNDYLKVVYDDQTRPKTDYPFQLCLHLAQTFEMKQGDKFLETGCGRCEFLNNFGDLGLDVYGADISSHAEQHSKLAPITVANVETEGLPYPNEHFDILYSKSFMEHLNHPEKYIEEAFRVLKPGGLLLNLVPDWESNYKTYFDDYSHRSPFTKYALEDIYKIYGFEDVSVIKFRQLPIVWKYPYLSYLCAAISPFIPVRTQNKFLRWSRELMLVGSARKPG
jgi:ubiquinone/menaquinone biosynthesis C-methylase UbiE